MYEAKIVLDSLAPSGGRLTTFEVTLPRMVLAELNTHCMVARNSASSRAVPVAKRIASVGIDPFIPAAFPANQKGMQGGDPLDGERALLAEHAWCRSMGAAVDAARELSDLGVHKQYANRVLEPYLWHKVVFSGTELDNLWGQRCSPMAQPELRTAMEMCKKLLDESEPEFLEESEWHLPYLNGDERVLAKRASLVLKRWEALGARIEIPRSTSDAHGAAEELRDLTLKSVVRCARVSYERPGDEGENELERAREMLRSGHMSPFEHQAMSLGSNAWDAFAQETAEAWIRDRVPVGKFWGWKQLRKAVSGVFPDLAKDLREHCPVSPP